MFQFDSSNFGTRHFIVYTELDYRLQTYLEISYDILSVNMATMRHFVVTFDVLSVVGICTSEIRNARVK
jgi:hypothetical protein